MVSAAWQLFDEMPQRDLSLQLKLTVVPQVCKGWEKVVVGPYCWQEIDIKEWNKSSKAEKLDRMLQMLVVWSCDNFYRLGISGLANEVVFTFMAEHASSHQTLELPRCELSNLIIEQVALRLANITYLDVSCCQKLGAPTLETFGKHCKSLIILRHTMHPLEISNKASQDDEAYAIAMTMSKLKHLEPSYCLLTSRGVLKILAACKDPELLDIRGCWEVRLEEDFLKKQYAGVRSWDRTAMTFMRGVTGTTMTDPTTQIHQCNLESICRRMVSGMTCKRRSQRRMVVVERVESIVVVC